MKTECKPKRIKFQEIGKREVVGKFNGGMITSDAGGLLLRETENRIGIIKRFPGVTTEIFPGWARGVNTIFIPKLIKEVY